MKMAKTAKKSTIPRPLNCFLLYRLEKQKEIVAKCTGANHRDISKIISNWWNNATEEEKKPFIEKARLAKQEHIRLHPGYKYTPRRPLKSKRAYVRKNKKEQFTSRVKENNKLMELIYESPSALDSLAQPIESPKKQPKSQKKQKRQETKYELTLEKPHFRPNCQFATPVNHCSFETTPQLSPYSESYYEYEVTSPCVSSPVSYASSDINYTYQKHNSVYSVLDTPYINDSNAYGFQTLDCLQYGASMDFTCMQKEPYQFGYMNQPNISEYYTQSQQQTQQFDFMMQCYSPEYIDPSLLQI